MGECERETEMREERRKERKREQKGAEGGGELDGEGALQAATLCTELERPGWRAEPHPLCPQPTWTANTIS